MIRRDSRAPMAASGSSSSRIFVAARIGSRHRDRLPLSAGELLGLGLDARHVHVDVVEVLAGELSHRSLVEEAERAHRRQLVAEEQVQVDRELRDQRQILVDGLDPVCARVLDRAEA